MPRPWQRLRRLSGPVGACQGARGSGFGSGWCWSSRAWPWLRSASFSPGSPAKLAQGTRVGGLDVGGPDTGRGDAAPGAAVGAPLARPGHLHGGRQDLPPRAVAARRPGRLGYRRRERPPHRRGLRARARLPAARAPGLPEGHRSPDACLRPGAHLRARPPGSGDRRAASRGEARQARPAHHDRARLDRPRARPRRRPGAVLVDALASLHRAPVALPVKLRHAHRDGRLAGRDTAHGEPGDRRAASPSWPVRLVFASRAGGSRRSSICRRTEPRRSRSPVPPPTATSRGSRRTSTTPRAMPSFAVNARGTVRVVPVGAGHRARRPAVGRSDPRSRRASAPTGSRNWR